MKQFLLLAAIFTLSKGFITAQVVMPSPYSSDVKINYVRTWEPVKPYTDDGDVISSSRTTQEVRQVTAFFDGLGRPLQTVIRRGSLITGDTSNDAVTPYVYDNFGREAYKFLSFASNNTGSNSSISDGKFKLNPFQQDSTFNKGIFTDETYYYSLTVFEQSPLHRPIESYAPGNSWVGTAAQSNEVDRRGVKTKSWINTIADSVRLWEVNDVTNNFGTYTTGSIYPAGTLFKNISQDENNKQVIEFKDIEGKIILKKVQLSADADTGTGKNHSGWLCTYYIYDDANQLRAVIQPVGVEYLNVNSWSLNSTVLSELCFRYEYDKKGRMIMKKVPGSGIIYMIYDAKDRIVMAQDSLQRADHKWLYTVYDELNRPITTGLITDNTYYNDAAYHRGLAEVSTSYPNVGSYTNEQLTKTFYDDYDWRSSEGNPLSENRSNSYDTYLLTPSDGTFPYPQTATSQSKQLRSFTTGTKTKILGTSTYLYTISFYDDKGRATQVQNSNITGGTDITTTQYSWSGQPLINIVKNENAGTYSQTSVVVTKVTYDDLFRAIKTEKKISTTKVNSGAMPSSWTTISEQEYDALGQLKKKKLGATPIETLNYEYNIRGWMLGMNRSYVKDTTSTSNWFGFDLGYDKTSFTVNGTSHSYTAAQYNGSINGMMWRSTGDDYLRKYDFTYDATNRFLSADFSQLNSNSFSKAAKIDFSVYGMIYDANGNILSMNQKGWKLGGSVTIDSLLYGYNTSSNKLDYVTDKTNDEDSKLGDFKEVVNNTSQDYVYDGNGNLIKDNNKKIDTILYNHLNLPKEIDVAYDMNPPYSARGVTYIYDATGNKLKKVVGESLGPGVNREITTLYLGGFIFETKLTNQGGSPEDDDHIETLQYISTEEGRARVNRDSSEVVYDYMVKDHLGNVRMILTEETDTTFYPPASMELDNHVNEIENLYYSNIEETREARPQDYTDTYTHPNDYAAMLYGSTDVTIGPAIALRVMAGDKFNIRVSSWWSTGTTPGSPVDPLPYLLSGLESSIGNIAGGHGGPTSGELTTSGVLLAGAQSFLTSQTYNSNNPKAYVNWILFDDRFNYLSASSGFEQVGDDGDFTVHAFNNLPITKNGYLYIYVSNATEDTKVFFDNLQVTHIRGPLLEENHYYPFGLTQAGISSGAINFGNPENKKRFQGQEFAHKEFSDDTGLELYEFKWRMHDPQIGRFWQVDPLSDKYVYNSPYAFSENNITGHVELEGLEKVNINSPSNLFFPLFKKFAENKARSDKWDAEHKEEQAQAAKKFWNNVNEWTANPDNQMTLMVFPLAMALENPGTSANSSTTSSTITSEISTVARTEGSAVINSEIKSTILQANKTAGKNGEKLVTESLINEFPGQGVLNHVRGYYSDKSYTIFDNIVFNPKTNTPTLANETKTGAGNFSQLQGRFYLKGESVTLAGDNAGPLAGQIINIQTINARLSRVSENKITSSSVSIFNLPVH